MKIVLKNSFAWFLLFLPLSILMFFTQPAAAQTDPESTPVNGYPPPATPDQPEEEAYPNQLPTPIDTPVNGEYIAPTTAPASTANPPAIVGDSAPEAAAVATIPISQGALVRNRAILWAGFLITLILFLLAVYGAILMYTRPRN